MSFEKTFLTTEYNMINSVLISFMFMILFLNSKKTSINYQQLVSLWMSLVAVDTLLKCFGNLKIKSYSCMVPWYRVDHAVFGGKILFSKYIFNYGNTNIFILFCYPPPPLWSGTIPLRKFTYTKFERFGVTVNALCYHVDFSLTYFCFEEIRMCCMLKVVYRRL